MQAKVNQTKKKVTKSLKMRMWMISTKKIRWRILTKTEVENLYQPKTQRLIISTKAKRAARKLSSLLQLPRRTSYPLRNMIRPKRTTRTRARTKSKRASKPKLSDSSTPTSS